MDSPRKLWKNKFQNYNGNTRLVTVGKKVVMMIKSTSKFHKVKGVSERL